MRGKGLKGAAMTAIALAMTGCVSNQEPSPALRADLGFDVRQCPPDTRSSPLARDIGTGTQASNVSDDPGFNAPLDTPIEPAGKGLWIGGASFAADDILTASPSVGMFDRAAVDVTFSDKGQHRFQCVQWGRIGRTIEMSLDRKPLVRPVLNDMIYGNHIQISVNSVEEAKKIAAQLTANAAP